MVHVDLLPCRGLDFDLFGDENGPSRDVPEGAVALDDVEVMGEVDLRSDHLQESHQEDQPVLEVSAMDVPQVELRDVSEALN